MSDHDDRIGSDGGRDRHGADGRPDGAVVEGGSVRRYLAGAVAVVTLFAAAAGYVVAANNAVDSVTVFGLVTLPGTPLGMALYGALLSLAVTGLLFGLVTVASRYDDAGRA